MLCKRQAMSVCSLPLFSTDKGPFFLLLQPPKRAPQWWRRCWDHWLGIHSFGVSHQQRVCRNQKGENQIPIGSEKGLCKDAYCASDTRPSHGHSQHFLFSPPPGSRFSVSIEKALPEDRGLYKCIAKNSAGQAECSCQVTVDGKSCLSIATTHTGPISRPLPHQNETPPRLSPALLQHSFGENRTTF